MLSPAPRSTLACWNRTDLFGSELGNPSPVLKPVFAVRGRVLFPGGLLRLSVGKPKSVRLVESLISKREDPHQGAPASGGGPNILLAIFNQR